MKVAYGKRYTIILLCIALLTILLILLVLPKSGYNNDLAFLSFWALYWLVMAALTRIKSYFELRGSQLIIYPLISFIGWNVQTFSFQSKEDFELVKNRLYLHRNGRRRRIWIFANRVEPADWRAFLMELQVLQ